MIQLYEVPTLDGALTVLSQLVAEREARGEKNFIFCEDKLTLLAERAVLRRTGGTFGSEVSTFSRFLAGSAKTITKQGSVTAISAILAEHGEKLACFKRGAAQAVYETIAQLSASRVDSEMLRRGAAETEGLLAGKLSDLAVLLEEYEGFLHERGLLDENGYLALLPEKIASGALQGKNVVFFAFPSFTAQAREGVRAAIEHAENVTGIFLSGSADYYTNEGANDFRKIAAEYGGAREERVPDEAGVPEAAQALAKGLFSPEARPDRVKGEVRIFRAEDEAEEMRTVAALIKKYISEGYRYRDIAVLVEGGSFFAAEKAFKAYKIPFFSDRKRSLLLHPFCAFVLSVLEIVATGGLPEAVDGAAANVYFGGGDGYRNYLLKYGGFRGAYKREIKEGEVVREYDRADLTACRERMLAAVSCLPAKGTGRGYAEAVKALYALIGGDSVTETLRGKFEGAEREFLDLSPLWSLLEETADVTRDTLFSAREFSVMLTSGLTALEISMIPQYADAVFVGDLTESKFPRAKILFCTGLTESVPRVSADTAVISDRDIKKLGELSMEIEPAIAVVNARARESLALNVCAFSHALYLSRPLRKADAETEESEVVSDAEKLFEPLPMPELLPFYCSEKEPALFELYRLKQDFEAGRENGTEKYSSLRALLLQKGAETDHEAGEGKPPVPAAAELYFGRDVSPTLLESYFACPYAGFVSRGLRLREREERSVLDTDTGTFVHTVLEKMAPRFNAIASEEECKEAASAIARELLSTPRFAALRDTGAGVYTGERLVAESTTVSLAAYRQIVCSEFRVERTEGKISLPALSLSGKADRVDAAGDYVRVIDYKTGEIDDKAGSYYTGRKLQLQLYLLAVSQGRKAAGAFYFPAADEFKKPDEEKFRLKGFFSGEDEVLALMDKSRKEGEKSAVFEGGGRTEKGMSGEDFSRFLDYARLVSMQAEREMRAGNVSPSPYEGVCSYCQCKGMCAFSGEPRKEGSVSCKEIVSIVKRERGEA